MALGDIEQFKKTLELGKQILVVFDAEKTDDAVAASLALKIFLEKQNKRVDIASDNFFTSTQLKFLPKIEEIKSQLSFLQKLIIKVDVSRAKIETLSYDIKDNWLSIHLNPREGAITKNDLRTAQTNFKYDLIITLGARDLESLGEIFQNNTDLFYKTPIINIDHNSSNEHYGQINIIDLSATSVSETVFKILEKTAEMYLDKDIAVCLLTGMISQTKSFKAPNVTPYTLGLAGKLMNLGADRETIIQNLYRTRSIATLKLWGATLSGLQTDQAAGLVWATLTREDFIRSGADEGCLKDISTELIGNSPEAKIILILSETEKGISAILNTDKNYNALEISQKYSPTGNKKSTRFLLPEKSLREAEKEIIEEIKLKTKKRLE